jgi:hypothetical protein
MPPQGGTPSGSKEGGGSAADPASAERAKLDKAKELLEERLRTEILDKVRHARLWRFLEHRAHSAHRSLLSQEMCFTDQSLAMTKDNRNRRQSVQSIIASILWEAAKEAGFTVRLSHVAASAASKCRI